MRRESARAWRIRCRTVTKALCSMLLTKPLCCMLLTKLNLENPLQDSIKALLERAKEDAGARAEVRPYTN